MSNVRYFSMINSYLFISLFLFSYRNIKCEEREYSISECSIDYYNYLTDNEQCFNKILLFNHKKYQVNHFAKNKNGDFVVEYTENTEYDELSSFRLFYGLTKDGRYFFFNESSYTSDLI